MTLSDMIGNDLAAEYARYSQDTQNSLEDQHEMNEETADENGLRIVKSCDDRAVSRSVSDREGLVAVMTFLAEHPEVRHLIIPQWDRLIGGLTSHMSVVSELRKLRVRLWTYDGELDYTNDDVLTDLEQKSVNASAEVRRSRKRVRSALRTKNKKGRYTSRPPFGLRMVPVIGADGNPLPPGQQLLDEKGRVVRTAALELDPTEYDGRAAHKWLVDIFEWTATPGVSANDVCHRLAAAGVRTKSGGTGWSTQAINRIIRNPTYLGIRRWGVTRIVHDDYGNRKSYERRPAGDRGIVATTTNLGPVIGLDLWERANAKITERVNTKTRAARSAGKRVYAPRVLNDLVKCGRCGIRMACHKNSKILATGEQIKGWRYRCDGRERAARGQLRVAGDRPDRKPCMVSHSVSEGRILDALRTSFDGPGESEFVWYLPPPVDDAAERAQLEREIATADATTTRIKNGYAKGIYDDADAAERIAEQKSIRADADARLAELDAARNVAPSDVPAAYRAEVGALMKALLADYDLELDTVEETTEFRSKITAVLSRLVARVEVDVPDVRIYVRPGVAPSAL